MPADTINGLQRQAVLDYRLSVRAKASVGGTSDRIPDVGLIDDRVSADQNATLNMKAKQTARWLGANAVSLLYTNARAYAECVSVGAFPSLFVN